MSDNYRHGEWLALCDRCGFKYHSGQMAKEWTGLRVCRGEDTNDCWEPRHPQDFVRGRKDKQSTAWARPEPDDTFLTTNEATRDDL